MSNVRYFPHRDLMQSCCSKPGLQGHSHFTHGRSRPEWRGTPGRQVPRPPFHSQGLRLLSAKPVKPPDRGETARSPALWGGLPPSSRPGKARLSAVTPQTAAPPPPTGAVWTLPGPRSSPSPAGGSGPLPRLGALASPANLYPRAGAATNRENKQTPARGGRRQAPPPPRPAALTPPPPSGLPSRSRLAAASPRPSPQPAAALPAAVRPARRPRAR